jgi:hypothetical protein
MKTYLLPLALLFLAIQSAAQQKTQILSPVDGKIVGIWPHENKLRSADKLRELREKYGFSYLLIAAPYGDQFYENVRNSGYDADHIMKQIYYPDLANRPDWFWKNIGSLGRVWAYYIDEPVSRGFPYTAVLKLFSDLCDKGFYPAAKFVVGELDEKKAERFLNTADAVMYSGYGSRDKLGTDQVQSWHDWNQYLGPKFSMIWISSDDDSLEYRTLLKAAEDQGINAVWFYQYEPLDSGKETGNENLQRFCDAAVEFGFLRLNKQK